MNDVLCLPWPMKKKQKTDSGAKRHMHIGVPGHGIVIAVPIKSVGGGKTVAF